MKIIEYFFNHDSFHLLTRKYIILLILSKRKVNPALIKKYRLKNSYHPKYALTDM